MAETLPKQRLLSLDLFRGLTIAGMLLVNNAGNWHYVYPPLEHAEWNGLTPTDLIFPFFLFIVGVAIKLSLDKYYIADGSTSKTILRILRRTILIFFVGLVLNGYPKYDLEHLRIMGVLQRIALCYLFASLIYIAVVKKNEKTMLTTICSIIGVLLIGYYLMMRYIPVPGYGAGFFGSPESHLEAYLDRLILGAKHIYSGEKVYDPEGILSTIPAIATTLIGVLCGWWIKKEKDEKQKLLMMFITGALMMMAGYYFDQFFFPVNKKIWTSSYVLVTGGMALQGLAICYWYTDIKQYRFGTTPFLIFGTNAIAAYFFSSIYALTTVFVLKFQYHGELTSLKTIINKVFFGPVFGDYFGSCMYAVSFVILWMLIMSILYYKKIYIKL
jgi:predicted acyltransferase